MFLVVAGTSTFSGILVLLLASDPRKVQPAHAVPHGGNSRSMKAFLSICLTPISFHMMQASYTLLVVQCNFMHPITVVVQGAEFTEDAGPSARDWWRQEKTCTLIYQGTQKMAKDICTVLHVRSFQLLVLQVSMC